MTIDVTAVNDAPTVANAIGDRSVAAGSNLTVELETDLAAKCSTTSTATR